MPTEQDGYLALVENLPEPVGRVASNLKVTYVNQAFCRHFAESREALVGRSVLMLVPEADRKSVEEHLTSLDAEHPVGSFEVHGITPEGEPRGHLWINRALHNENGNLVEYHTLVRDLYHGGDTGMIGARDPGNSGEADGPPGKTEQKFRSVVHNSSEIVKIADLDGTLRYASPAFGRILGYDPEQALGTNVLDYVHPEDLPRVREETEKASTEGGAASNKAEYRFRHKDGSWRWIESVGTYLLDDPVVRGVLINARDVTERKEAEEEIKRLARRNALILDSAGEGIYGLDREGRTTFVNSAAARLTGFAPEDLVRKSLHDIIHHSHPDGAPYHEEECPIRASLADGEVHCVDDEVFWRKDGTSFPVEYTSTPILEGGEVTGAVVTFTDIAGRKEAEAALRKSEEHFRSLIRGASDIVALYEADGTIRYASPALGRVLGYEPEERIGSNAFDLIHPEDIARAKEAFAGILRKPSAAVSTEVRARHRDGSWRHLEAVGTNLLDDPSVGAVVLNGRDVTERKEAEEALRGAEQLYRTLVEQIPAVTYVDRADGSDEPLYTSPQIEEMLGYTPEEWIGGCLWPERLHPDDRGRILAADERFEAGEGAFSEEYRLIARDESIVWVREDAELVSDEEGRPLYWQGVMLGITQAKEAEEAVRGSEKRFRSLVRNASDVIMVVGEDGRVRYVSPAVERVLGFSPGWVEGRDAFEIVHPDDVVRVREAVVRPAGGQGKVHPIELRLRHADGSWRHVESVVSNLLADPAVRGVVVNSRDVTERRQAYLRLLESEERFRSAFDGAPLGVAFIGLDQRYLRVNGALCEMLGYSEAELLSMASRDTTHPGDLEKDEARGERLLLGAGEAEVLEKRYVRSDGGVVWVLSNVSLVRDAAGTPGHFVALCQDITGRKETEDLLRESEAQLRRLADAAFEGIVVTDPGGRVIEANEAYAVMHGYERSEIVGRPMLRFVAPEDHPRMLEHMISGFAEPYEITGEKKDGTRIDTEVRGRAYSHRGQTVRVTAVRDVTERKAQENRLRHRAFHDPLTDLPNRALFADRLGRALERTRRKGTKVAVLFMDLNGFKIINDSLGHRTGDLLLVIVAQRLKRSLRPEDTLARFGGDEFVVLLEDVGGFEDAAQVSERVMDELRKPFAVEDKSLFTTASIGIALGDAHTSTPEDLLRNADTAMYRAKEDGTGYRKYDPNMREQVVRRLEIQNDLRRAAEAEEFTVRYQPIVDLRTGLAWGTEALMRWDHPERGLLDPSEFMLAAEENGLIFPLGEKILREACDQTRHWQQAHNVPFLAVSVNLSAEQLRPGIIRTVEETLRETGLDADRLSLDVAESTYRVLEGRIAFLNRLKALGVRLSIDDFGVGYSSLFHLKRLPADILKVDQSFVAGLGEDEEDAAILRMVVELAHTLGIKVIAEGVENDVQLAQLQEMNCDLAQGFLFCGPRPAEEISPLLASGRPFG